MTQIGLKINVHCVRYGHYGRVLTHVAASPGLPDRPPMWR